MGREGNGGDPRWGGGPGPRSGNPHGGWGLLGADQRLEFQWVPSSERVVLSVRPRTGRVRMREGALWLRGVPRDLEAGLAFSWVTSALFVVSFVFVLSGSSF